MYDQETDRRALTALFNATAGAGWRDSRGWMEKLDDIQTWFGVSVNDSGRVNAVLLPRNDLNGNVPPEIWDLDELERLGLGDNLIKGNLPSIPENRMKKLVYFSVGTNQITGTLPDLHLLPNLKEAVLDKNKFTGELPRSIGRCKKLERLWIFSNKLTGKLPSELGNLTNMKKLDISDNLFSGAIPEECTKMTKLMEFKIRGNSGLTKPGIPRISSSFDRWTENQGLDVYLKGLKYSYESMEIPDEPGNDWLTIEGMLVYYPSLGPPCRGGRARGSCIAFPCALRGACCTVLLAKGAYVSLGRLESRPLSSLLFLARVGLVKKRKGRKG